MEDDLNAFFRRMSQGQDAIRRVSEIKYSYNARELVFQRGLTKLYHYHPKTTRPNPTPVLVVFATVNRPEILDLFPETSFIRGLLDSGMDVYLLDWGYPTADDNEISMSDYITDYLHFNVKFILEKLHLETINLLGICQGGVLSLCYSVLFPTIKNLVLISTPIDFKTADNKVGKLLNKIDVNDLVDTKGNVPGEWLTYFFISLRPFELVGKKYLRFVDNVENAEATERFLHVEKWLNDAPDQTGTSFKELLTDFYQQNKLIKGEISIYGRRIDLGKLTIPVLNVMAEEDEIVPMSASRALKKYIGSYDYTQKKFPSGHIGIYVSEKVGKAMPKTIAAWIEKHETN